MQKSTGKLYILHVKEIIGCNPCLNDHFKKIVLESGFFWAFLRVFG
jgi:hypothetical protein